MGVGTNILGYNNVQVNNSIKKVIKTGNMTTLNCPEEVYLAEKLIWHTKCSDCITKAK